MIRRRSWFDISLCVIEALEKEHNQCQLLIITRTNYLTLMSMINYLELKEMVQKQEGKKEWKGRSVYTYSLTSKGKAILGMINEIKILFKVKKVQDLFEGR